MQVPNEHETLDDVRPALLVRGTSLKLTVDQCLVLPGDTVVDITRDRQETISIGLIDVTSSDVFAEQRVLKIIIIHLTILETHLPCSEIILKVHLDQYILVILAA